VRWKPHPLGWGAINSPWDSTKPELVVGWSFMLGETIINMIVVVVGILLYRAYLKCENKIESGIGG